MLENLQFGLHPLHQECYRLALQSKCLKRRYGAVVVTPRYTENPEYPILGGGYNHEVLCGPCESCPRLTVPSGTRLELCYAIHAEQDALLDVLVNQEETYDCDVWVLGIDATDKPILLQEAFFTCSLCARMAMTCGVLSIVVATTAGPVHIPIRQALEQSMQVARGERVA